MEKKEIFTKIALVMNDLTSVSKARKNTQQNYSFRGIDDVYNAIHEPLAKHGVFTVPQILEEKTEERTTKGGSQLIYRVLKIKFTFYAQDGSNVECIVMGEAMDSGDKACNKAMASAHKYALLQVFAIPTEDEKDTEYDSRQADKPADKPQRQSTIDTPAATDIYSGTAQQKNALFVRLTKEGISTDKMKVISDLLHGKMWSFLETLIQDAKVEMENEKK